MEKKLDISPFHSTKALLLAIQQHLLPPMIKLGIIYHIKVRFQSFLNNGQLIFVQLASKIFFRIGQLNKLTNAMMLFLRKRTWVLKWTQKLQQYFSNPQRLAVSKIFTIINLSFIFYIVSNGTGVNMLKVGSKRRRTKREIEEENQKELQKENEYRTKMARLDMVEQ